MTNPVISADAHREWIDIHFPVRIPVALSHEICNRLRQAYGPPWAQIAVVEGIFCYEIIDRSACYTYLFVIDALHFEIWTNSHEIATFVSLIS